MSPQHLRSTLDRLLGIDTKPSSVSIVSHLLLAGLMIVIVLLDSEHRTMSFVSTLLAGCILGDAGRLYVLRRQNTRPPE